jgi:ribosomal protein S18 acetylase RimI-like enzyme
VQIRPVRQDEHAVLGDLTADAYIALEPSLVDVSYDAELRDIATRAAVAEVLVAVDDDGTVLGGVTYVPDADNPLAEFDVDGAAGVRMLAVAPAARRRGVGEALTVACIVRARAAGRTQVILHSTPVMTDAHRIYTRLGFVRATELDWEVPEVVVLWGFRLTLV